MSKKTVLFVTQGSTGGAERIAANVALMLDRKRYTVKFVAVCPKLTDIANIVPQGDELIHVRIRNIWDFSTLRMIRVFRRLKPDYVFCSAMYLNPRIVLAAKAVGNICIILRNSNSMAHLRKDKRLLMQWTYPLADIIVAQQEEMGEEIIRFIPAVKDRVRVLHNPLDTASIDKGAAAPSPYGEDKTVRYVNVARINPVKGQDVLIEAFLSVHRKNPNTSLYLVGRTNQNPAYYQRLQEYIRENGLEDAVHFTGHEVNPYKWVKNADCFVLSSRKEGLPNCMIEAMYLGVPVVAATCIPIIGRMVENGVNGYKVPVEDAGAMAEAMLKATALQGGLGAYHAATREDFRKLFE